MALVEWLRRMSTDQDVEVIRRTICEAEVLQGIGRVRGVRRTATDPVLVFVLNQLDLYHLPVSELSWWAEVAARCGPRMRMAVRGCVPKMWSDIARLVGRWQDSTDPAACARGSYRDNPAEKAALDDLFARGEITHPFSGQTMKFRKEQIVDLLGGHRQPSPPTARTGTDATSGSLGDTTCAILVADRGRGPAPILVSVKEARRLIGISRTGIYALINDGRIETVMIGKRRMIRYASLRQLAEK